MPIILGLFSIDFEQLLQTQHSMIMFEFCQQLYCAVFDMETRAGI